MPLQALLVAERAALLSGRDEDFTMVVTIGYTGLRWGETIGQQGGLRGAPLRWAARPAVAQLRSPDVMSPAEAPNSRCDRIGVAPYRPAR